MVAVTPQSVRERINLTESAVSDDIVNRFIADAAETLELETGLTINPASCTEDEAVAIRNLAAVSIDRHFSLTGASFFSRMYFSYRAKDILRARSIFRSVIRI